MMKNLNFIWGNLLIFIAISVNAQTSQNFQLKNPETQNPSKPKIETKTFGVEKPLIIIDGKEAEKDALEKLNANDVEKIEVLKNDKAKKLYGQKGKKGVILIYTKKYFLANKVKK